MFLKFHNFPFTECIMIFGHFRQFPIFNLWVRPLWFSTLHYNLLSICMCVSASACAHVHFHVCNCYGVPLRVHTHLHVCKYAITIIVCVHVCVSE